MSARLLKGGLQSGITYAPFSFPTTAIHSEPEFHPVLEDNEPDFSEAKNQAQQIIEAARAEAAQLIRTAEAQVAQLQQAAHEQGLIEARAKATEEIQAGVADLRAQWLNSITELDHLYPTLAARAERDLVKLALEIARKVVHREVSTDPDITVTLARVALERLHPRAVATLRLHPDEVEYVNSQREKLNLSGALEIVADSNIGRGGCLVQSEHGDLDARIDQQFATIERGFFES